MRGQEGRARTVTASMRKETEQMNVPVNATGSRRRGLLAIFAASVAIVAAMVGAGPAQAAYGVNTFDVEFTNEDGSPATQAGSHPHAATIEFEIDHTETGPFEWSLSGRTRDLLMEMVAGFVGDTTVMPRCKDVDFLDTSSINTACPARTVVGVNAAAVGFPIFWISGPIYNLEPPPGVPARVGFEVENVLVVIDIGLKNGGEYNVTPSVRNTSQILKFFGAKSQLWGKPSDPSFDGIRCGNRFFLFMPLDEIEFTPDSAPCPVEPLDKPFLTLPRACNGPLPTTFETNSWEEPANWVTGSSITHDEAEPPNPQGFTGCGKLDFSPTIESKATNDRAESGTGLDFNVDFDDEGLTNPKGIAGSEIMKAQVTLPEGVTINPSVGEGLGVCTPADLDRETVSSAPGEGCPNSSKLGTLHLETPLADEAIDGSVYLAQQDDPATTTPGAENPFDTLIALYMVLKNPDLGVIVKEPIKVEPDPKTGRLVATLEDNPQVPFSHFNFHFREGQRAALITPATCGTYTTEAKFWPWADPNNPRTVTSSFEITEGVNGGPCPPGGVPPFKPDFQAGALNNNAGSFSEFDMRLLRSDGEQDMTKFSSILPPGQVGSLVGIDKCADAAIEAAKAKTGRQELASPSCPANSQIGRTLAGAGVGSALTYVPGQLYLGGPYKGDPLSVISITPAVAGPFDAGTVVIRLALTLNPKTAEVEVDGANSDPIPHIIKGIVLKARDLRVYVDRPNFILNPTSCDESSTRATLFGSYLDVFNPADDVPVDLSSRYQAANCLNLGFKPKLNISLKGGTKRGGHPGLKAVYRPRKGDANVEGLVVRLPRSAFLDQAHIRTICTRVQFASDSCPPAAQYGYIKAWTPLLDEPLEGPVWLRSSNHKLPDLVFDLHGLVDVEVSTRLDSQRGGIRATVESAPDAPLSKVELRMQGGKKGLIINSRNLCGAKSKANVQFSGHNGKQHATNPVMRASGCGGKRKR
jgi:hypothetical protein